MSTFVCLFRPKIVVNFNKFCASYTIFLKKCQIWKILDSRNPLQIKDFVIFLKMWYNYKKEINTYFFIRKWVKKVQENSILGISRQKNSKMHKNRRSSLKHYRDDLWLIMACLGLNQHPGVAYRASNRRRSEVHPTDPNNTLLCLSDRSRGPAAHL